MSTVFKAADLIGQELSDCPSYRQLEIARILDDAGLLAPDLPEPDDKRTNGDASWAIIGKATVDTWHDDGGPVVELRAGRGRYLIPAEARRLARILLAAANHAEAQANE